MTISHSKYIDCVHIYTDGACPQNPGFGSIGVIVTDDSEAELERYCAVIGSTTNNAAEYKGLIVGLDIAAKYTRRRVECYTDSEVVAGQVTGRYRLKADHLRSLYHQVKDNERPFDEVVYCRVSRKHDGICLAHDLAQTALQAQIRREAPEAMNDL